MQRGRTPLLIAHRGRSAVAPENTVAAFAAAAELPAVHAVECDVHLSADGACMVLHDATVRRTTGAAGVVAAMTRSQLRRLDAGSWFGPRFAGERIPTLDEFLDAVEPRRPLIEIKAPAAADAVVRVLRRRGRVRRAILQSFRLAVLVEIGRACPSLRRGWLIETAPGRHVRRRAVAAGLDLLCCHKNRLDRRAIAACHADGLEVWAWTVNESAEMAALARAGADGLIADDPLAAPWLARRPRRDAFTEAETPRRPGRSSTRSAAR